MLLDMQENVIEIAVRQAECLSDKWSGEDV